jgi:hypothetical protein
VALWLSDRLGVLAHLGSTAGDGDLDGVLSRPRGVEVSDLIARLRDLEHSDPDVNKIFLEAAAEIERLRAALKTIANSGENCRSNHQAIAREALE